MTRNLVIGGAFLVIILAVFMLYTSINKVDTISKEAYDKAEEVKTYLESEDDPIDFVKNELANFDNRVHNLESNLNDEVEQLKTQLSNLQASKNSLSYKNNQLEKRLIKIEKELEELKKKREDTRLKLISSINKVLSELLDHRLKKISIFEDDSSFAFYVGRRNYLSLEGDGKYQYERTIHYSSTGQYLQKIYQDKDNGNNRFIRTSYLFSLPNLNLNGAEIKDYGNKEELPFQNKNKEENYAEISIPLISGMIDEVESIEFNRRETSERKQVGKVIIYTKTKADASEVLNLLKILKDNSKNS